MISTGYRKIIIDTFVDQASPNTNFDKKNYLFTSNQASNAKIILLRPARPEDITKATNKVLNATLRLTQRRAWTATHNLTIRLLSAKFIEGSVNWNNKPGTNSASGAAVTVAITGVKQGTVFDIELASIFENAANNGWPYYGIQITSSNTSGVAEFFSELDTYGRGPQIRWRWTIEPVRPTQLHPSAVRSSTTPRFWANTNNVPVETQQIQVATDALFQSLVKNITVNNLSQKAVDYTPGEEFGDPLAADTIYYWRCRYTTPDGLISKWSNTSDFSIRSKPTLEITSVAATLTNDATPTLNWTYSSGGGGAQSKYSVQLREWNPVTGKYLTPRYKAGVWSDGWNSGTIKGSETQITVPVGVLRTGKKYLQVVRVWDSVARDDDSTDSAYTRATNAFKLLTSSDTAPFGSLEVSQISGSGIAGKPPIAKILMTRSQVPDRLKILRRLEGSSKWHVIAQGAGTEFLNKNDDFQFTDICVPGTENFYKAMAISNNIPSQSTTYNPFFEHDDDNWTVSFLGSATGNCDIIDEINATSGKIASFTIRNGGNLTDIRMSQNLPVMTEGQEVRIRLKLQSREQARTVKVALVRNDAPYTVFGEETFEISSESPTKKLWAWTVTAAVVPKLILYLGGDTADVDIDHFFAGFAPMASITPTTNGWWLIPVDHKSLRVPLVVDAEEEIETAENRRDIHPLGSKFIVLRSPGSAKRLRITALINEEDGNYLERLQRVRDRALDCYVVSSKGRLFTVQLGTQNEKLIRLPNRQLYQLTLELLEVD